MRISTRVGWVGANQSKYKMQVGVKKTCIEILASRQSQQAIPSLLWGDVRACKKGGRVINRKHAYIHAYNIYACSSKVRHIALHNMGAYIVIV